MWARLTLIILIVLTSCRNHQTGTDEITVPSTRLLHVKAVVAKKKTFSKQILSNGTVRAARKADLHFKTSGYLVSVRVKNGMRVSAGQVVAALDNRIPNARLQQAKIELQKARKKYRELLISYNVDTQKTSKTLLQNLALEAGLPDAEAKLTKAELQRISTLKKPYDALAVFPKPAWKPDYRQSFLYLDHINDPGNLGTVIRTADWFGVRQIVCSPGSADVFNPKTVQATMGALANLKVFYIEPADFFPRINLPVFAAGMQGENTFNIPWPHRAVLVLGNEAHGISPELIPYTNRQITIPHDPAKKSESLNVAIAAAVILGTWFAHR